jgi:hypothetical protein
MLKQTVQFEDFDGTTKSKDLYFNLTADDVFENADIEQELAEIQEELFAGDEPRELNLAEKARVVALIKRFMKMSYGVQKVVDGDRIFDKSDEIWNHFTKTAAYDAFLFGMFADESGKTMQDFLSGVFPAHIRQKIQEARAKADGQEMLPGTSDVENSDPAWVREKRYPTQAELIKMDQSELMMAMKAKTEGWYGNSDS